ncbi:unnamed protein product [Symbiodinium sp. CCMP2592]|nr:unnamed protein product [Symbiodinium sp. CCMP2592]
MALPLALYRWVDHRRVARAMAVAVLLMFARLMQRMQQRLCGVSRMKLPLKTLLPRVPTAAAESAACQVNGADEVEGKDPTVSSVIYQCVAFRIGDFVAYPGNQVGQIIGFDDDHDLVVRTDHGRKAVWYISKCSKTLSAGDRVRYPCGEVGTVMEFDEDGDLYVHKEDGTTARWYASKTKRLLSVGDKVQYACGEVATVTGFDCDGDVFVVTPGGRRATWFAQKCL